MKLIRALNLTEELSTFLPNPDSCSYYLQSQRHRCKDVRLGTVSLQPETILRRLSTWTVNSTDRKRSKFSSVPLFKTGFRNLVREYGSYRKPKNFDNVWKFGERFEYFSSLTSNLNAQILTDFHRNYKHDKRKFMKKGLNRIIDAMLKEFTESQDLKTDTIRKKYLASKLACIYRKHRRYYLTFVGGGGVERVCARRVVLAIPPHALHHVSMQRMNGKDPAETTHVPLPKMEVFPAFGAAIRSKTDLLIKDVVVTDLPSRRFIKMENNLVTINVDGVDADYFRGLYSRHRSSQDIFKKRLSIDLLDQLERCIYPRKLDSSAAVLFHDWGSKAKYVWKRCIQPHRAMKSALKPLAKGHEVYVVGSDYCDGGCQVLMEGALRTSDFVLKKYLLPSLYRNSTDPE
ncbi:DgyrCDS3602 [Dimorphilus gyrociliatus]|nr:DgyrCDS3602 [Dimorphilus gyrociliatus]